MYVNTLKTQNLNCMLYVLLLDLIMCVVVFFLNYYYLDISESFVLLFSKYAYN